MSTRHLRNIFISQFESFLELALCELVGIKGGHCKYSRDDLRRPVIFQTHIQPVPEFIVKNALRALSISKEQFWDIMEGHLEVRKREGRFVIEKT